MSRRWDDFSRPVPEPIGALGWFLVGLAIVVLTVAVVGFGWLFMMTYSANAQTRDDLEWMKTWIPKDCCSSNHCCWQIQESELTPLPGDKWQVNATGQIVPRRDWSPDGKFYRCACDQDGVGGPWIKHQGANTRCLFIPMRSAGM